MRSLFATWVLAPAVNQQLADDAHAPAGHCHPGRAWRWEATQACLAKHVYVSIKTGEQLFGMFLYMGRGDALLLQESAAMSALAAQPAAEEAFLKKKKALPCRETNSSPRCRSRRRREDIYLRAVLPKPVRRLPRRTKYL